MHRHTLGVLTGILAVLLWVTLLGLVNRKPPTAMNQVIFLLLWGSAVACTTIPVALMVQQRRAYRALRRGAPTGRGVNPARARRQGLLAGMLAAALMALHFLGVLNTLLGVFLVLLTALIEMLGRTREID